MINSFFFLKVIIICVILFLLGVFITLEIINNKEVGKIKNNESNYLCSAVFPVKGSPFFNDLIGLWGVYTGINIYRSQMTNHLATERMAIFTEIQTLRQRMINRLEQGNLNEDQTNLLSSWIDKLNNIELDTDFALFKAQDCLNDLGVINQYVFINQDDLSDYYYNRLNKDQECLIVEFNDYKERLKYTKNSIINQYRDQFDAAFDVNHNHLIILDLTTILSGLSLTGLINFINIMLVSLMMSSIIHIIYIKSGNYLISRFNLKIKYPKLAKFIQFRFKIVRYALIYYYVYLCINIITFVYFNLFM